MVDKECAQQEVSDMDNTRVGKDVRATAKNGNDRAAANEGDDKEGNSYDGG